MGCTWTLLPSSSMLKNPPTHHPKDCSLPISLNHNVQSMLVSFYLSSCSTCILLWDAKQMSAPGEDHLFVSCIEKHLLLAEGGCAGPTLVLCDPGLGILSPDSIWYAPGGDVDIPPWWNHSAQLSWSAPQNDPLIAPREVDSLKPHWTGSTGWVWSPRPCKFKSRHPWNVQCTDVFLWLSQAKFKNRLWGNFRNNDSPLDGGSEMPQLSYFPRWS